MVCFRERNLRRPHHIYILYIQKPHQYKLFSLHSLLFAHYVIHTRACICFTITPWVIFVFNSMSLPVVFFFLLMRTLNIYEFSSQLFCSDECIHICMLSRFRGGRLIHNKYFIRRALIRSKKSTRIRYRHTTKISSIVSYPFQRGDTLSW